MELSDTKKQKSNLIYFIFALLIGFVCIAFNSKNSFLYSFNDSCDVHCFLTTAKSMIGGDVLYRDIYEQKGPVLYFIYIFALLISRHSFIGIYLIESVFFSVFLFFTYKTARLYIKSPIVSFWIMFITGVVASSNQHFCAGGQCEELALPFMAVSIYLVLRYFRKDYPDKKIKGFHVILIGFCFATIFWMKYTVTGMYLGLVIVLIVMQIKLKKPLRIFLYAGEFLFGALIASLPVIIYFAVNNAFSDLWEAYFYNLIFVYSKGTDTESLLDILLQPLTFKNLFDGYLRLSLPVAFAFFYLILSRRKHFVSFGKASVVIMMIAEAMGLSAVPHWSYVSEAMYVFASIGFITAFLFIQDSLPHISDSSRKICSIVHKIPDVNILYLFPVILVMFIIASLFYEDLYDIMAQVMFIYVILCFSQKTNVIFENKQKLTLKKFIILKYVSFVVIYILLKIFGFSFLSVAILIGTVFSAVNDCENFRETAFPMIENLLVQWKSEYTKDAKKVNILCTTMGTIILTVFAFNMSSSKYDIGKSLDTFPQGEIAEYINNSGVENPVIVYGGDTLDLGIYWLTDTYPPDKYFCTYNNPSLEGVQKFQHKYIENSEADFIISNTKYNKEDYELVYTNSHDYRYEANYITFNLYQKRSTIK